MNRLAAFAAALCGLLLAGCPSAGERNRIDSTGIDDPAPVDRAAVAEEIRRLEARGVEAWASRDVERIIGRHASGGSLIVPCQPRIAGRARIRAHVARLLRDRNFALVFDPDRVVVARSGDLAYVVGTYLASATNPATGRPHSETGNYLTVYRRAGDGLWQAIDGAAAQSGPPRA
jgi:uncharacterized protein (TIGR02246 family)